MTRLKVWRIVTPMNILPNIKTGISACPHDCPSACALEVEVLEARLADLGAAWAAKQKPEHAL